MVLIVTTLNSLQTNETKNLFTFFCLIFADGNIFSQSQLGPYGHICTFWLRNAMGGVMQIFTTWAPQTAAAEHRQFQLVLFLLFYV